MDTTLTIERIAHALDVRFGSLIDLTDLKKGASEEAKRSHTLSRSLAALAIMTLSEADPQAAAESITDGYDDLGIDAIYYESADNALYVVQSKWHVGGQKTIDEGECAKFVEGVKALIRADFSKANARLKRRENEVREILLRPEVRITLVLIHTGSSQLGDHVSNLLNQFLARQNNVGDADVFTSEIFDLRRVYAHLDPTAGRRINLDVALSEWGLVREPYRAYYGQVKLSDVAGWAKHGKALFDRNLRFYRGSTEVNDAMDGTIAGASQKFWYFNNGITVLCETIGKAPLNGDGREWGVFQCTGVSIVNGAQTVGAIWERSRLNSGLLPSGDGSVQLRIISLENCPAGFGSEVTLATNNQNEIKHRDFAALDETQHNLAREMTLDGRRYAFKSGDIDPKNGEGCTIEEATIALACASNDIAMAVVAKRYVGGLWKDITKPPYTTIFNQMTRAHDMWRAVVVSRAVARALEGADYSQIERGDQIAVHGNRFILHLVFQDHAMRRYKERTLSEVELTENATAAADRAFRKVAQAVKEKYAGEYLQPLFKNIEKCKGLFHRAPQPQEDDLFKGLNHVP